MSILDDIFGGGANQETGRRGQEYLDPYRQGGTADYNQYRNSLGQMGNELGRYGNPMDWMWKHAGMSPQDYYQSMMEGYNESPQAKYEREQMTQAVNNGAAASGMIGSGAYMKELQQNAHDISARDMQQYYDNMLRGNNQQFQYGQNYQNQQDQYRQGLFGSSQMGYNAANDSAKYAGQEAQGRNEMWGGIGNAIGGIGRMILPWATGGLFG